MRTLVLALTAFALVACFSDTAHARLERYFDLPANTANDTLADREAILRRLPLGTLQDSIEALVRRGGVGTDGMSSYYRAAPKDTASVRVEYDRHSGPIVKTSYLVRFAFDSLNRLQDVHVTRWLTGP